MNLPAFAARLQRVAVLVGSIAAVGSGSAYAQSRAALDPGSPGSAGSAPSAGAHDDWQDFDAQTHAAAGAVPPPSVLTPHAPQLVDEEGRRWLQAIEMRDAAAAAPTTQLTLAALTSTLTLGAAVPAVLFAAGAGPCHLASCRDLEMQLWVAGGLALGFAILSEELLRPLTATQSYRAELIGDAEALTHLLTLSRPDAHYSDAREAQIARSVHSLQRLLLAREQRSVELPALFTGISAGAAAVFGTYALLFAVTADSARPRTTEQQVFSVASAVSLGAAVSGFVWLQNTRSARAELSQRIEMETSQLRELLPAEPPP